MVDCHKIELRVILLQIDIKDCIHLSIKIKCITFAVDERLTQLHLIDIISKF